MSFLRQIQAHFAAYTVVAEIVLGQMTLSVLVLARHAHAVRDVERGTERTGVGGVLANKGGKAVKFSLYGTTFCFVSSHLAAHQSKKKVCVCGCVCSVCVRVCMCGCVSVCVCVCVRNSRRTW